MSDLSSKHSIINEILRFSKKEDDLYHCVGSDIIRCLNCDVLNELLTRSDKIASAKYALESFDSYRAKVIASIDATRDYIAQLMDVLIEEAADECRL